MSQIIVVITAEYNVMVESEELIGGTEYLRLQTGCHRKWCHYKWVWLYFHCLVFLLQVLQKNGYLKTN